MAYVDSKGRIVAKPALAKVSDLLISLYFGILLFLTTLFKPAASSRLEPANSMRNTQTGFGGGNGGNSGGHGGPRRRPATLNNSGAAIPASQACCGASY